MSDAGAASRRRRWTRVLGALGVAGLAAGVFVGCSAGYTDGARPGQVRDEGGGTLDSVAHQAVVQLPLGPLTVEVGKPTQETTSYDHHRAADGSKWVPIAWTLGGQGADYDNNTPAFQFQVTLLTAGRRYGLQAGLAADSDQQASKYTPIVKEKALDVVVQGDGAHLRAEVEYDGVSQSVDFDSGKITSGLAAPLYRKDAPRTALPQQPCPVMSAVDERRFRASPSTQCTLGAVQTQPYVGGLGWVASPKQSWTLVPLDLRLIEDDAIAETARYSNFDVRLRVSVDGRSPTTEILRYRDQNRLDYSSSGVLVFRTSSTPHSLRVMITARGQNEYRTSQFYTFTGDRTYRLS